MTSRIDAPKFCLTAEKRLRQTRRPATTRRVSLLFGLPAVSPIPCQHTAACSAATGRHEQHTTTRTRRVSCDSATATTEPLAEHVHAHIHLHTKPAQCAVAPPRCAQAGRGATELRPSNTLRHPRRCAATLLRLRLLRRPSVMEDV